MNDGEAADGDFASIMVTMGETWMGFVQTKVRSALFFCRLCAAVL